MTQTALAFVLVAAFGLPTLLTAVAQQKGDPAKLRQQENQKGEVKGRLPPYYGQIVDAGQRQHIYQIQATFNPQIEALRAEIDALMAKRDAEIRAVLSPAQQQQLDTLITGAQAARAVKAVTKKNASKKQK